MKKKRTVLRSVLLAGVLLGAALHLSAGQAQPAFSRPTLRLLTINVWSGLDYKGSLRFGAYEPRWKRQARYRSLLGQIRELGP